MKMRRKCRIWWPKQLLSIERPSCSLLFGWFSHCSSASLDIVIAVASSDVFSSHCQSGLQEVLHKTDLDMPVFLQDKSKFSCLGLCSTYLSSNGELLKIGMEKDDQSKISSSVNDHPWSRMNLLREDYGCGCDKFDGFLGQLRQASITSSHWIQLIYDSHEHDGQQIHWIPKLHHIHWNGQIVSQCDVHVIVYETPKYGVHHFSLSFWNSSEQVKAPLKKPKWVDELHQKQPLNDLDTVILAINCSAAGAAKIVNKRHVCSKRITVKFSIILISFTWQLLAMTLASLSTLFYMSIHFFYYVLSFGLQAWICLRSKRVLSTTWVNVQIRCCQILYWPIFLRDSDCRFKSCVEFAEKAALHKHSMWSALVVDVLLGNLIGLALLCHAESICSWVSNFSNGVTNEILRSGCVWLMGVPAGFKLNTELAGVLGIISLNAIQIWSTLWIFMGSHIIYFVRALALLGITFGVTIPAALVIDIIALATLHVRALHWFISLLYSQQIQVLAGLWRLFRGQKWNPLRQRLDSYEYSVKQHIVGSLLFTPILLLLPTTSVFYIFFTIMNTAISSISILIEVAISIIHATPYNKILLWMVRRRRFPSGIWFEILTCQQNSLDLPDVSSNEMDPSPEDLSGENLMIGKGSILLVSILHSNFLSIGQVALPHYKKVFSGISGPFFAATAYGVLTGKRMSYTLGFGLPSSMPWMSVPFKEYWRLCRNSILSCMRDYDSNACE